MNEPPKILVVDDEPDIQTYMRMGLKQRGYNVILAASAEEAIPLALTEHPDLILMDVRMPGMDGMEACKRIKAEASGFLPIILVTVQADLRDKIAGMDHGADDYLAKPFVLEELYTRVASMLRIKQLYDDQEKATITDPLTGAHNRRYFQVRLKEECNRATRYGQQFSCLMLDIDHFKNINDQHGHPFGDAVLKQFAEHLRRHIRRSDILVRYGGEEFILILPETGLETARQLAETLRASVEKEKFSDAGTTVQLTCSVGVCPFPALQARDFDSFLKCLDDALYQAKKSGRNRVSLYAA